MSDQAKVTLTVEDGIGIVTVDHPPVNAMNEAINEGLNRVLLEEVPHRDDIQGVIIQGANNVYIAGADITMLQRMEIDSGRIEDAMPLFRKSQDMYDRIEDLTIPVLVAIQKFAMGGGLELAMAGHYRMATKGTKLGQPEVNIGIIPGAGGTQRLPRLVGLYDALMMNTAGVEITADKGLELGLIDRIVEGPGILDAAKAFLREILEKGGPIPRTRYREDKLPDREQAPMMFQMARMEAEKKTQGHYPAPLKAIDAMETGVLEGYEKGIEKECRLFLELAVSDVAKNLMHVFLGTREVSKAAGVDPAVKPRDIGRVAVIGAGFMGHGIAQALMFAGIPVVLKDIEEAFVQKGLDDIRKLFQKRVDKGKMTREQLEQKMSLVRTTTGFDGFAEVDMVIEAAVEDIELKKKIFAELDERLADDVILASNTSTIPIHILAGATRRPDRVIGMHFFSPVHMMKLLEIIKTGETSDEAIVTSMALAKKIRKTGIVVNDHPGFLVNFILGFYGRVAGEVLLDGAGIEQIDKVIYRFGMPMGPLTMSDMAGNDVAAKASMAVEKISEGRYPAPELPIAMYEAGRLGMKVGKGYYQYEKGERRGRPDPDVEPIIEGVRQELGIEAREVGDREIEERIMLAMVNGAIHALDHGIAMRAIDVDIAMIFGTGFPPFRGGPIKYADSIGAKTLLERLERMHEQFGPPFEPSQLLRDKAAENARFYS